MYQTDPQATLAHQLEASSASLKALLGWFSAHKRALPWRQTQDPYAIWVSEIMLQQTQAATVIAYYNRFLSQFPTVFDLAQADETDVLKAWEGLGYYSRARNLHAGAQTVCQVHQGLFPKNRPDALKIKGVGAYTAGAILSFAYGLPYAAVDGNVLRVLARFLAHPWSLSQAKDRLTCAQLIETTWLKAYPAQASRLNEALIELGALICTPREPQCRACPLKACCRAHALHQTTDFPLKRPPRELPVEPLTVLVITGRKMTGTFVQKRPAQGLLAGLYAFPMLTDHLEALTLEEALIPTERTPDRFSPPTSLQLDATSRWVFTHKIWSIQSLLLTFEGADETLPLLGDTLMNTLQRAGLPPFETAQPFIWVTRDQLPQLPLIGAHQALREAFLSASPLLGSTEVNKAL